MKSLIIVSIIAILIGFTLFKLTKDKMVHVDQIVTKKNISHNIPQTPTPSPTLPPIDQSSNLDEEINKLTPQDFSEDFKKLKEEVSQF